MEFDIYCDESFPDILTSESTPADYLVIGGLWMPTEDRSDAKKDIHGLREKHKIGGEFKWQKISKSRLDFYTELVEWFMGRGDRMRFRCIAVERSKLDLIRFHDSDHELGFYKFYYQLLHHWILDFNEYSIFCDHKSNRVHARANELSRILGYSNLTSTIKRVQSTRSEQSVLLQLADTLTGIASARLNDTLNPGSAKETLAVTLESLLGRKIEPTYRSEHKFNVFRIDLDGGW